MFYFYVLGGLTAIFFGFVSIAIKLRKRQNLAKGVVKLGNFSGKHYNEVTAVLGTPAAVEKKLAQNTQKWVTVATWRAGGYQIVIMFDDNDIFNRIVSESTY